MADESNTSDNVESVKMGVSAEPAPEKKPRGPRQKKVASDTKSVSAKENAGQTESAGGKRLEKPVTAKVAAQPKDTTKAKVKSGAAAKAQPVERKAPSTSGALDDIADLVQLEQENARLRKALSEKLRSENADLRKRLGLK